MYSEIQTETASVAAEKYRCNVTPVDEASLQPPELSKERERNNLSHSLDRKQNKRGTELAGEDEKGTRRKP